MYWSFKHNQVQYISWGQPRCIPNNEVFDLKPRFDIPVYRGEEISSNDSICMLMQGDATLGLGDSIWLISFMRDVYRLKARRRAKFIFVS